MATPLEVKNSALRSLGVIRFRGAADPEHQAEISEAYDELYARLKDEELVSWSATGNIPAKWATTVIDLLAFSRANQFSVSNDRFARLAGAASVAERYKFVLNADDYTPPVEEEEPTDY